MKSSKSEPFGIETTRPRGLRACVSSTIASETQTIASAVYALIQTPAGDREATQLIVISMILAFGALLLSEWFARRATLRMRGE